MRLEPRAPVAGALHRHDPLHGRPRAQLVDRELELALHVTTHAESPVRRHLGDVEVDQQIVQPDGRDLVAQRLERHAVVPRRKLQLVEGDAHALETMT